MPYPKKNETEKDYIKRCLSDSEMKSKHPEFNERFAVCKSFFVEYETEKISFDYDDTLSTERGKQLAKHQQGILYIISARQDKEGMLATAKALGIPENRVFATGSNKAKIEKIKELGISKHYDNNTDVINQLGSIGVKFMEFESYNDYPKQASENAKIALRWADEHGWGECLEATGKARAHQLANGENISEDTIARMAAFERHRQHSDRPLGEGCGRLAWLAWGGDAGIEWAQRKLKQIRK